MGICSSSESIHVATAKLVLQDGRLQEFSYPVKASYVLQKNPTCFICNSDEMDFDDVVTAIEENEELLPGQLYFALPLSKLNHPLQAEEMAALAVKASSALMKSGGYRRNSISTVSFSCEDFKSSRSMTSGVEGGDAGSRRGRRNGGRRRFSAMLTAIPE